jgi:hypothetical protein
MNKCVMCGNDSGRGKTCGSTCRSKLARSVAKGVASATVRPSVATVKQCAEQLPSCVPIVVQERYNRYPCEPEYMDTINHLLEHTLDELKEMGTWIPVWRVTAGQDAPACPVTA